MKHNRGFDHWPSKSLRALHIQQVLDIMLGEHDEQDRQGACFPC